MLEDATTGDSGGEVSRLVEINREKGIAVFSPQVIELWERGEGAKARKLFLAEFKTVRSVARQGMMAEYVEDARFWLSSLGSTPSLFTFNGIGTMLYGRHQPEEDGTYVATQWLVLLFLPLFPLGAYLVHPAPDGGWFFLAKAPLPPLARTVRLLFGTALLVGLAAVGGGYWFAGQRASVVVYNGYDVPVSVRLGPEGGQVPPGVARLFDGVPTDVVGFEASASAAGVAFAERREVDLTQAGYAKHVIYNVGGRGTLVLNHIVWGDDQPRPSRVLGSEPVLVIDEVDYVFEEPPETQSVVEGSSKHASILGAIDDVGLTDILSFHLREERLADALRIALAELEMYPGNPVAVTATMSLLASDPERGRATLTALLEKHPVEVELHRAYQHLSSIGNKAAVVEEYRKLLVANPTSASHHYLLGRLVDEQSSEPVELYRRAIELDPNFSYSHWALAWRAWMKHDHRLASEHYARFAEISPANAAKALELRLRAARIVGFAGDSPEVTSILESVQAASGQEPRWEKNLIELGQRRAQTFTDYFRLEREPGALAEVAARRGPEIEARQGKIWARLDHVDLAEVSGNHAEIRRLMATFGPDEIAPTEVAYRRLNLALSRGATAADEEAAMKLYGESLLELTPLALIVAAAAPAAPHQTRDAVVAELTRRGIDTDFLTAAPEQLVDRRWLEKELDGLPFDMRGAGYFAAYQRLAHAKSTTLRAGAGAYRELARRHALPGELPTL